MENLNDGFCHCNYCEWQNIRLGESIYTSLRYPLRHTIPIGSDIGGGNGGMAEMLPNPKPELKFSELLDIIGEYGRETRQHLRNPVLFEEDRQKVKRFLDERGINLLIDE